MKEIKISEKSYEDATIKVVLGLSSHISYAFYFMSIMQLIPPKSLKFSIRIGDVVSNLNFLTKDFELYDAIFLTEWDHTFPKDCLRELWNTQKGVVAGLYRSRSQLSHPFLVGREAGEGRGLIYRDDFPLDKPFTTQWTGIGAMLVRREVWQSLEKPFFQPLNKGIDRDFCMKLRREGHEIWINPLVRVGHLSSDIL